MSLQIKFTIPLGDNCKSFTLTETTGVYNNPDNLTGWGTPNPTSSDINYATVSVENLTTGITYDLMTYLSPTINTSVVITTAELLINGVSIGDITLPDGQYCFTLTYVLNDTSIYSQQVRKVFLCESCCKIKTKACEIDIDCGCCNDDCADEIWKFLQAYTEMKIIEYSAYCGSSTNINNKIKSLQALLTTFDCKNC